MFRPSSFILAVVVVVINAQAQEPAEWYAQGRKAVRVALAHQPITSKARNLILFVGDGMGISTVTAARILDGQRGGGPGEENLLSFERFPYTALLKTYTTNQQTSESAGTMTAMVTGVKTKSSVLSVNGNVRANKLALSPDGRTLAYTDGFVGRELWMMDGFLPGDMGR